jgi:hypothetical protein
MQSDTSTTQIDKRLLTADNFLNTVLTFRDRQAGVSVIFDPDSDMYSYNAYCLETKLLKELFTCEYQFLDEALAVINAEFGSWERATLEKTSGCGSCAAK